MKKFILKLWLGNPIQGEPVYYPDLSRSQDSHLIHHSNIPPEWSKLSVGTKAFVNSFNNFCKHIDQLLHPQYSSL
jgi:hypothetical protein